MSQTDVIINVMAKVNQATQELKKVQKTLKNLDSQESFKQMAEAQKKVVDQTGKLKQAMGQTPFAGWAMSIMFFGMAIQRVFDSIWKSSTKTFQDISHSVEGTTTGFDMLEGSMKFMQFVAGEALEPIAAFLIPIIDGIAEWISNNQSLFAGIMVGIGILGTFLMTWGTLKLAVNGVHDAIAVVKLTMDGIKNMSFTKITGAFSALKAEVIATGAAMKTMSLGSLLGLAAIIAGIVLLVMWWFKLKDAMGGWGEFFKAVLRGVLRVIITLADWIVTGFVTPLQYIIGLAGAAIRFLGGSEPKWMSEFVNWKPNWAEDFAKAEQTGWLAPSQGYAEFGGLTPDYSANQQQQQIVNNGTINVEAQDTQAMLEEIKRSISGA